MSISLPPLKALASFEAAARHRSFRRAAEELHLSVGSVSRYIGLLEAYLGVSLFERTPNGVRLKDSAFAYSQEISSALNAISEATSLVGTRNNSAYLRLAVAPTLGSVWFMHFLETMKGSDTGLAIDLNLTTDFHTLTESSVDVAITSLGISASQIWTKCQIVDLWQERYLPICSPSYWAEVGPLSDPAQIFDHETLVSKFTRQEWFAWAKMAGVAQPRLEHGVQFDNSLGTYYSALRGRGFALGEVLNITAALESGELVIPFENIYTSPMKLKFYYSANSQHKTIDLLLNRLQAKIQATSRNFDAFRSKAHY
jgi:LysR family glycine cleavage system transcriptional activator